MKLMDKLSTSDAQLLDRSATTIVAQVEALRKLVDAFGDYAREPQLDRALVDINALIGELAHLYGQARPDMSIHLDLAPGIKPVHADKGQLRQLLHNLIRNAAEAVGDGEPVGITISTRIRSENGAGWLDLAVSDEGPGFPEELLKQPFEPYVTSKPQGSGLGLAICRKIVVDHDGSIKVSNQDDAGARVTIRLPLRPENG
jgi:nitrogen fixation/metabolism regulation signal transduction histidine kinase